MQLKCIPKFQSAIKLYNAYSHMFETHQNHPSTNDISRCFVTDFYPTRTSCLVCYLCRSVPRNTNHCSGQDISYLELHRLPKKQKKYIKFLLSLVLTALGSLSSRAHLMPSYPSEKSLYNIHATHCKPY